MRLLLVFLLASGLRAADPIVTAELSVRDAWLADPVELQVRVHFEDDWTFDLTQLPKKLGAAVVLDYAWQPVAKDVETGLNVLALNAQLAWYEIGDAKIPSLEIKGQSEAGQARTFVTPELNISIQAMLDAEDEALAPPRSQVELPVTSMWPWLIGVGLVLLIVAVWVFARLRRRTHPHAPELIPRKPPYDEALERLRELTLGSLLKEGRFKQFYVEINLIIRTYYGRLKGIPAEEMTTIELEDWFEAHGFDEDFRQLNHRFQGLCDSVKYAKYEPVQGEHSEVVNWAHEILEKLKPEPEEVQHVAVG